MLTHLGRRGNPRSRVLDAALLALLQLLAPIAPVNETNASGSNKQQQLDEDELSPLSAKIDLSLLSWLLLYLSACLDDGRDINSICLIKFKLYLDIFNYFLINYPNISYNINTL